MASKANIIYLSILYQDKSVSFTDELDEAILNLHNSTKYFYQNESNFKNCETIKNLYSDSIPIYENGIFEKKNLVESLSMFILKVTGN